jgi:hypothetical protein
MRLVERTLTGTSLGCFVASTGAAVLAMMVVRGEQKDRSLWNIKMKETLYKKNFQFFTLV